MARNYSIPTEDEEQIAFVNWCKLRGYKIHHSPNESGGLKINRNIPQNVAITIKRLFMMRAKKMKEMGTSKGFPDLLVFVPVKNIYGEIEVYQPICVEMKRTKGSTTSEEQKDWINTIKMAGIPSKVCKGCDEAIKFVSEIIGGENEQLF